MILTAGQLNALCRVNRSYAVIQLELDGENGNLNVHAIFKGGKVEIRKGFTLDAEGNFVGIMQDEGVRS
jgi:hypothetical protein